jgi:hypothetical protein
MIYPSVSVTYVQMSLWERSRSRKLMKEGSRGWIEDDCMHKSSSKLIKWLGQEKVDLYEHKNEWYSARIKRLFGNARA